MFLQPPILAICVALLAVLLPCPSLARDETTVGITINGTSGEHVEPSGVDSVPFLPLPIFEADYEHRRVALHLEGVPPIGPVSFSGRVFGQNSQVSLSYLSGDVSVILPGNRYSFGIGETVLNQQTDYPRRHETQTSRVVGARYIVRGLLYTSDRQRLEASFAFSRRVHAVQRTVFRFQELVGSGPAIPRSVAFEEPEHASLVDTSLRWSIRHERWTFLYGLRYINYAAAYDKNNSLADRNHFLMPFIGFERRLDR